MLLWINGAFGSGKTTAAYELKARYPHLHVLDPEEIGFTQRRLLPPDLRGGDFQDQPLWRAWVYDLLEVASRSSHPVIVPMTLVNPEYFSQIVERLRSSGLDVRHVTLMASRATLLKRLARRRDGPNSWPAQQIERCVSALEQPEFANHLDTDALTFDEVVEAMAREVGLEGGANYPRWQRPLRHLWTSVQHIRR